MGYEAKYVTTGDRTYEVEKPNLLQRVLNIRVVKFKSPTGFHYDMLAKPLGGDPKEDVQKPRHNHVIPGDHAHFQVYRNRTIFGGTYRLVTNRIDAVNPIETHQEVYHRQH